MTNYVCSICGEPALYNSVYRRHYLNCECGQRVWVTDEHGGRMKNVYDAKPIKEEEMGERKQEILTVIRKIKRSKNRK